MVWILLRNRKNKNHLPFFGRTSYPSKKKKESSTHDSMYNAKQRLGREITPYLGTYNNGVLGTWTPLNTWYSFVYTNIRQYYNKLISCPSHNSKTLNSDDWIVLAHWNPRNESARWMAQRAACQRPISNFVKNNNSIMYNMMLWHNERYLHNDIYECCDNLEFQVVLSTRCRYLGGKIKTFSLHTKAL